MKVFGSLLVIVVAVLVAGCETKYTRIQATNYRGEMISEWTAKGRLVPLGRGGYGITAVERHSPPPNPVYSRFPDGWRTTVQGAHIWRWECPKPDWLAELDGDKVVEVDPGRPVAGLVEQYRYERDSIRSYR